MKADFSFIEQLDFEAGTVRIDSDPSSLSALKLHYLQQAKKFDDQGKDGIDAIYFSGEYPSVYFKKVPAFTPEVIQSIVRVQRKIWNQGKVLFLHVESPTEIRVYNCYETPKNENQEGAEDSLRLFQASIQAKSDLEELVKVFGKVSVESGSFWQEKKYADQVDLKKRVDQALVTNIKRARLQLRRQNLKDDTIHDLLLRSLFILYLEDRKATNRAFYEKYLKGASSYFDILKDVSATYRLLEVAFNGNLCPVQDKEQKAVKPEHLDTIKRCFWSDLALSNQATLFDWRIFDFEYIPIQVISEIYEDFLSTEVGAGQMAKTGAFYTPHALAEFILNEVLPYPSRENTDWNIKTLDPTCGSGIFLVDSLNRLLDRWEYAHKGESLTFDTIKQIVLDNIFGIEIEPEAIKVAAFSIYLAMLDRLDPKTLWQNNRFPYLIYDEDNRDQQQGKNLFRMSSLGDGPFTDINYDLVVGNPPFTNKVAPEVMDYLEKHDFGKETVIAFLHRVTELCPAGKIALLSTSKILFNNGTKYQNFREFLFNRTYVEKVYNFSALRRVSNKLGGRNLFATATRPVSLFIYTKQLPKTPSERIIYYAPTTAIKNRLIDGIAIDSTDVKYLPRNECRNPVSKIWKVAMWGTERDFELVNRLNKNSALEEYMDKYGFVKGVGFRITNPDKVDLNIRKFPYISPEKLNRYYTLKENTEELSSIDFKWLGAKIAYNTPHVLIKYGQEKKRFCASFLDYDCSFSDTIYGIHSEKRTNDLKLLTAYLNSNLASYLMFLTSGDWGVERERVTPHELLSLPDLCFTLPFESQFQIIARLDELIYLKKENLVFSIDQQVTQIEDQIEDILWDGLELSSTERVLVEDFLTYRLGAFQDRHTSDAFLPVQPEQSQQYASYLCQTINHFLQPDDSIQARAEYFNIHRTNPLQVVVLHLDSQKKENLVEELPVNNIDELLRELEAYTYREEAESIYYRRFIRYYKNDTIYIVKPNERRFWSRSMALNDADEIILEIMSSEV
jgi:hypothetical protein